MEPAGLLFKTRTIENACVHLHKQRNDIPSSSHPSPAAPSSWGCIYLNVCLNGECYCSNHGWHHSTFPLCCCPPTSPPAISLLLQLYSWRAHTHTLMHAPCVECAMLERNSWITAAKVSHKVLEGEKKSGKRKRKKERLGSIFSFAFFFYYYTHI